MKKGHDYNINDPRYVKTLGPVVSIATDNALAPAEQVVDDDFLYNTTAQYLNTELTDDDKSQWLINRILRDHLRNVENGNFAGDVTINGDLTVNGEYMKLPIATTTKAGIVRLSANSNDVNSDSANGTPVPSTALVKSMLNQLKDLLMGGETTPDLDTILELANVVSLLRNEVDDHGDTLDNHERRISNLEECCEELHLDYTVSVGFGLESTNGSTTVEAGSWYYSEIRSASLKSHYDKYFNGENGPIGNFSVKMDGVDITNRCAKLNENHTGYYVDIPNVTGDIVISGDQVNYWRIAASIVPSDSVVFDKNGEFEYYFAGQPYYKKLKINAPYNDLDRYSHTINHTKFTTTVVTENGEKYLEIRKKTPIDSNLAVTVTFSENTPTPMPSTLYTISKEYNPNQVSLSDGGVGSNIAEDSEYEVEIYPKTGFQINSVEITHNGQTVTPTIVGNKYKATISPVKGNIGIAITSSEKQQETIPTELANVEKIYLNDHATRIFAGEWDINSQVLSANASAPLPRDLNATRPTDSSMTGSTGFENIKYYYNWQGGMSAAGWDWTIVLQMKEGSTLEERTAALDYIIGVISDYNDSVSDELKVVYTFNAFNNPATHPTEIRLAPYKFNAGAKRTIEVVLTNIPNSLVDTTGGTYWEGQHYTKTTQTNWPVAFVVQDKSTAVYEVVDENNNIVETVLGESMDISSTNPDWALFGNYRYLLFPAAGEYTIKLRAFGITNVVKAESTTFDSSNDSYGRTHKYALNTNWNVVNGGSTVTQPAVVNVNTDDSQITYGWDLTAHHVRNLSGNKTFKPGTATEIEIKLTVGENKKTCTVRKSDFSSSSGKSNTAYNYTASIEYGKDPYSSSAPIKDNTNIWDYIDDEEEGDNG